MADFPTLSPSATTIYSGMRTTGRPNSIESNPGYLIQSHIVRITTPLRHGFIINITFYTHCDQCNFLTVETTQAKM